MTADEGWIDISVPLKAGMVVYPGDAPVRITRTSDTARGDVATVSRISMGLHSGTHIDAPLHLFEGGLSIDRLPLQRLIGTARVIAAEGASSIDAAELKSHPIESGQIVLFKTRNSALGRLGRFCPEYVYLTPSAAAYLVEARVRAVGIDYLSIDAFGQHGLEAHSLLLRGSIPIIEGLDLSPVGPGLYEWICLPLRIEGGEAAPARAMVRRLAPEH
jgi:arylformamidase